MYSKERKGDGQREKNVGQSALYTAWLVIELTIWVWALIWNWTCGPSVHGMILQASEPHQPGKEISYFYWWKYDENRWRRILVWHAFLYALITWEFDKVLNRFTFFFLIFLILQSLKIILRKLRKHCFPLITLTLSLPQTASHSQFVLPQDTIFLHKDHIFLKICVPVFLVKLVSNLFGAFN